ncbi:MAG: thiamine diphosphokinase [Roseobacter sp.]|nr:thiamine diphosphokinase [Roseobacter sp.]
MKTAIVHDPEPVLLVGGGQKRKTGLKAVSGLYRRIVAADSGADWLMAHGHEPDMVIGDLDSISPEALRRLGPTRAHRVAEQDSTDFVKCLTRIDAPLVLGVGFLGGRLDHELAALHALAASPERRCVLVGGEDIVFLAPPVMRLDLAAGARVSVFPLGPVRAQSSGLRWPLKGVAFDPLSQIGTSNEALGAVELSVDAPKMLVILPRSELRAVVTELLQSAAVWPPQRAL